MVFKKGNVPWNKGLPKEKQPNYGKVGWNHTPEANEKNRLAHLGKIPSRETRRKISESHKGRKFSEEHRKNLSLALMGNTRCKGRTLSDKHKEKIRVAHLGRKLSLARRQQISKTIKEKGLSAKENNPNWRGGIMNAPYPFEFGKQVKLEIRERDNFKCKNCGLHEEKQKYPLAVHHINYDKHNNKSINLVSLCNVCHGKTGYNRDYWISRFTRIVGDYQVHSSE